MNWILLALCSAVCTSLTTILAKIGIKNVNSNFATAYRTCIVLLCSLVMCAITGNIARMGDVSGKNILFLALSGISTGFSWLFYFAALKEGDVNKVAPVDKSSFVLTAVLFLIFFFDDTTKGGDPLTIGMLCLTMALMLTGTFMMLPKSDKAQPAGSRRWIIYAILSAVFAAFVSLFVKLGLSDIPSDVGTFYRTLTVLVFAFAIVLAKKDYRVYAILGDGEVAEGQVWEAMMAANKYHLDNLCACVDVNGLQIDGETKDVMPTEPLDKKFEAFGWHVIKIDGHDFEQIEAAYKEAEQTKGQPTMILAKTIKGKGVSFMENNAGWHGKAPNDEQWAQAKAELEAQIKELEG